MLVWHYNLVFLMFFWVHNYGDWWCGLDELENVQGFPCFQHILLATWVTTTIGSVSIEVQCSKMKGTHVWKNGIIIQKHGILGINVM